MTTTLDPNSAAQDPRAERRLKHHESDVVVVGAGVFGCAAAYALANQGRSVILLERWLREPDRIVGELLQPGGVASLRKLGLGSALEGIDAIPCHGYHVLYRGEDVVIPYPRTDDRGNVVLRGASAEVPPAAGTGPAGDGDGDHKRPEGRGFHHGRFIAQLRRACQAHPNISVFETTVVDTVQGEHGPEVLGVRSRTADPATGERRDDCFFGKLTVIADGYDSKFRRRYAGPGAREPEVKSRFYALELRDCDFAPANYGHVVIGDAFPVLLYQIGARETRALIDVPERLPAAAAERGGVRGYIRRQVLPALPEGVRPAAEAALADGRVPRCMPNSYLPPSPQGRHPGVVVLGDAMNMRHPLTGGGMTVALNDAALLEEVLRGVADLGDAAAVRRAMREFGRRRRGLSSIVNVLSVALYSLFAARDDRWLAALREGCFAYFRRGVTEEPVAMLGGLVRRPALLARHFFSVALLAVWLHALAVVGEGNPVMGVLRAPLAVVDGVMILWRACVVFLPYLYWETF